VAPQEVELLKQADLIISLDWHDLAGFLRARLGPSQTQQPAEATIIHCSPDSYVTNGWSMDHQALPAADIPVLAHPDRLVGQLLDALPAGAVAAPRAALAAFEHWISAKQPALPAPTKNGMAMRDMAATIESFFAGRAITYARLPIGWPSNVGRFTGPLDYMGKDAGGAVGTGPAHTVGIALALKGKGRLVLGVMGDGDFLMGSNAIWTAVQMKIPMLVIVANNRAFYNDVVHQETVARQRNRPVENKWVGQNLGEPAPDIAGMARAQGLTAEGPIANREALLAALQRATSAVEAVGQYLLDVHIDPAL
jgi:thiamine pyrophosphate-dependent acetolactate synthase large subunit-like protein